VAREKQVTITDIARSLNTTVSTVSRALSNHPSIGVEMKKKVEEAARKLNYRPNVLAANLRRGNTKTIGMIVPLINRHFFANVIAGVDEVLHREGYNLLICQTSESLQREKEVIENLIQNRIEGIVMSLSKESFVSNHIKKVLDYGIPLVQFDRVSADLDVNKVVNDNFNGSYGAVSHLIEQGCRRIAHFGGMFPINIYSERLRGYKQALADSGLNFDNSLIFENVLTQEDGYALTINLLQSDSCPDGLFSASDMSALGALLAVNKYGSTLKKHLRIAGYANEPFTEFTCPSLTSVEQHSVEMGRAAATMLLDEINHSSAERIHKTVTIPAQLFIRNSSLK